MKRMMALLLAAVLGLGCTACAEDTAPVDTQPVQRDTALTVVTCYGGDDGNRSNFVTAVKAYEQATGVTVYDHSAASNEQMAAYLG